MSDKDTGYARSSLIQTAPAPVGAFFLTDPAITNQNPFQGTDTTLSRVGKLRIMASEFTNQDNQPSLGNRFDLISREILASQIVAVMNAHWWRPDTETKLDILHRAARQIADGMVVGPPAC